MKIQTVINKVFLGMAWVVGGVTSSALFLFLTYVTAYVVLPSTDRQIVKHLSISFPDPMYQDEALEDDIANAIVTLFPYAEEPDSLPYWIASASEIHNVDPYLLSALLAQESSFRVNVRSWAGAVGLGQVKPEFWEQECGLDVDNPYNNVLCSAFILSTLIEKYQTIYTALAVYNVGHANYTRSEHYRSAGRRYAHSVLSYNTGLMLAGK